MPRIPVYQRQTELRGYQPATMQNTRPDLGTEYMERAVDQFGDSVQNLVRSGVQLKLGLDDQARLENQKIEAAQIIEAQVELSNLMEDQRLGTVDPMTGQRKPGLMDRTGKDAAGIENDFRTYYDKESARIAARLPSKDAKMAWQNFSMKDKGARSEYYAARTFEQMKQYQVNQQAAIDDKVGRLAGDSSIPDNLAEAALDESLKSWKALKKGESPEFIAEGEANRLSNFAAVRLSAAPDYASKQAAYAKYGKMLQGEQAVRAREMLKVFGVKDKAQDMVNQLSAAHDLTTGEGQIKAQAEISNITDTEVYDEAQRRLDYRIGQSIRLRSAQDSQTVTESMVHIRSGAMPKDIPGYSDMRPEVQQQIDEYSRSYRKGQHVDQGLDRVAFTDPKKWDAMQAMSAADFMKFNDWTALRGSMIEDDVRGLQNKQAHMVAQHAENVKKLGEAGAKAWQERQESFEKRALEDLLKTYENTELSNSPEDIKNKDSLKADRRFKIESEWMKALDDHYQLKGRAPTQLEVAVIRNRMTDKVSTLDDNGDMIQKYRWELNNFDREVGNQYDTIKEYQQVNGLSDANLEKQMRDSGMTPDAFLQKLNDQAMGDFLTNSGQSTAIPFKKASGFREQSRERQAAIMSQSQIANLDNKAKALSEEYGGGKKGNEAVDAFTDALPELMRREGRTKEYGFWANLGDKVGISRDFQGAKDLYKKADEIQSIKDPAERRRVAMGYLDQYQTDWNTYRHVSAESGGSIAPAIIRGR
jgi:hypothetical protein